MANPTETRPEIEIIPPGSPERNESGDQTRVWVWRSDARGSRVYLRQPGPLAILATILALAGLASVGLVVFLGLFLLWLPVMGAALAAAIVLGMLRGNRRHLR